MLEAIKTVGNTKTLHFVSAHIAVAILSKNEIQNERQTRRYNYLKQSTSLDTKSCFQRNLIKIYRNFF